MSSALEIIAAFELSLLPHEIWVIAQDPLAEEIAVPDMRQGFGANSYLSEAACAFRASAHWQAVGALRGVKAKPAGAAIVPDMFDALQRLAITELSLPSLNRFAAFAVLMQHKAGPAVLPYVAALYAAAVLHPNSAVPKVLTAADLADMQRLLAEFVQKAPLRRFTPPLPQAGEEKVI